MSPLPACWRILRAHHVTGEPLRTELEQLEERNVFVFVDALVTDVARVIGASPPAADPDAVCYRTGDRLFLRGPMGDEESILEQLRAALALLEPGAQR